MSENTFAGNELGAYPVTAAAMRSAGLAVCGRARGLEDARLLCEAIGLVLVVRQPPPEPASDLCTSCGFRLSGRKHWNLCVRREPKRR